MLDDLPEKGIIELPPPKCPEEAGKTNESKYCQYHRIVSHPLEKCIALKECTMQLAKDGTIIVDLDEVAEAKHTTFCCKHCDLAPSLREELVTFESWKLVVLPLMVCTTLVEPKPVPNIPNGDDEGWILVTKRRPKKQRHIQPPPFHQRKRQGQKSNPRYPKGKKRSNFDKKHEIQLVD